MSAATSLRGLTNRPKQERYLVTPEGIEIPIMLASKGSRLGAIILDFLFFFVVIYAVVYFLIFVGGGVFDAVGDSMEGATGAFEFLYILFILFLFFMRYGYFMAMELGPRSATWGKRIVGIRVAARDGGRLTPEAVIARNLLRDIELFMPLVFLIFAPSGEQGNYGIAGAIWFAIFMFFPFFNKDNLRAGDIIAGTWVVEAPRTKLAETLSTSGAAASAGSSTLTGAKYEFGEAELSVYGEHELQVLERLLREDKDDALGPVHETICRKIGWDPGAGDERAFLEAFYAQLRAKLEGDMRFGKRKANKHA
ncbi:RDD family protein [Erythrobacter sp. SCSIO 43205]|uniref:RDD family protein n=1 Tax=Erythrobacter sp. SCSIO 43205 TaxID=2779361 RepID=UPI001CA9B61B|nr:RDD family protein [Erythrobacter sp. SCSIO 43205]UAB78133.1 RDD family protein [Erythrobacter sp. SCSIO 43205]